VAIRPYGLFILRWEMGCSVRDAAMCFRKGSPRNVAGGKSLSIHVTWPPFAVYLAIVRHQPNKLSAGGEILTLLSIGRRGDRQAQKKKRGETSRLFDWVLLLSNLAIGILNLIDVYL